MTQQALTYRAPGIDDIRYLLHLPPGHGRDRRRRWPLILFLHGMGERGADLERVRRVGLPAVAERRPSFPFLLVSPQCPRGTVWSDHLHALDALLDEAVVALRADRHRLYLSGLSMGGAGAWWYGTLRPRRFAAIVPICGPVPPFPGFPAKVAALRRVPVWAFHGARDPVVPLSESETLVETLRRAGGDVRLTVFARAGHDAWTRAYAAPALYMWMPRHRRP